MTNIRQKIVRNFDAAATTYDVAATWQAEVAQQLVEWAKPSCQQSATILDIGCGTGLLTQRIVERWPAALITGLDAAPQMLREAKKKLPEINTILGDASSMQTDQRFDAIFSSMVLHWLPQPLEALQLWRSWLKPHGHLFVALPVQGSFEAWRKLCQSYDVGDTLWPLSLEDFADKFSVRKYSQTICLSYAHAVEFLISIKKTGAFTKGPDKYRIPTAILRKLIRASPQPFCVHLRVVFLELHATALGESGP